MLKRALIVLALLAVTVAVPLLMRPSDSRIGSQVDRELRVITPHNETIRREFGNAFTDWWKAKTGESVYVNWLTPGGTSEIRRVLDSGFTSAQKGGRVGIGIDVFFGGGDYIFSKQASADPPRLAPLDIFETSPDLFSQDVIPARFTGENYYDKDKRWIGVCLSRFGICYNKNTLQRLGIDAPMEWSDLTDHRYVGQIALADPTKSGSVAKAFEMLIQQQMQTSSTPEEGWIKGLQIIQKIGANARYFTDSATKVPHDVAQGDSAAGMCIDFYGRTFNEMLKDDSGDSRIQWVSPQGGTSMSVDPIAVLTGAAEPELSQEFVNFCLSKRGQAIWNKKPGTQEGPEYRALRRLPIRRDMYSAELLKDYTDPDAMPYETTGGFSYDYSLTGRGFSAIRLLISAMCISSHDELKSAWIAIAEAGFPDEAMAVFSDMSHVTAPAVLDELRLQMKTATPLEMAAKANDLSRTFRKNYERAEEIARTYQK